jgi:HlyD family secretion protein
MTLKVPFPAGEAAAFQVGQAATVTLDSTFEVLQATVKEVSGAAQIGVGNRMTRNVTVEVKNPGSLTEQQAASAEVNGVSCTAGGYFRYKAQGSVAATVGGTVESVLAPEGTSVKKDDVILTLTGKDLDDMLRSAADSLRNAELSMQSVQDQLDNYTFDSPIKGTIVDKQYESGDTVEVGKVLCTIYDLSYLEMTLPIDELDIRELSVGQVVHITADAVAGQTYSGTVTKVSVAGTTSGGTTVYPVTLRIDETDGLLPGMNVDAELIIAKKDSVLSIPAAAVARGNVVLVTTDSPSAANALERTAPEGYVYVSVEPGISDDDRVEILSGLQEGDTVAYIAANTSSGYMAMMAGMGAMGHPGMGGPR